MIPFHRPMTLNPDEMEEILHGFHVCLQSGQLTNGANVRLLESKIKEMYDVKECIALSSCTQGLLACILYLKYYDINFDEISLPSFTWQSLDHILDVFAIDPIFVDINKDTWLPYNTKSQYSIGHHTFGNVSTNRATIFDGSHSLGCRLPNIGQATVFSLAATKLITSCEGGLVITNNEDLAGVVREYRDKCARMSEIHAIIGLQMLLHLDEIKEWKCKVYSYYSKHIPGIFQETNYDHNFNTIGFLNIENLFIPKNIETKQYYEPLRKGLNNTDYIYENIICLPSFIDVDYKGIVGAIKEANEL